MQIILKKYYTFAQFFIGQRYYQYKMKRTILLFAACCMLLPLLSSCNCKQKTEVIAHRGFWGCEGSAQNSIASLQNAARIGTYGSEFDVNLTPDSVLVVNHDATFKGYKICETPYYLIKDSLLSNGEKLPLLRDYLQAGKQLPDLKMIFELKTNADSELERIAIDQSIAMIKEMGIEKQIVFISFSLNACKEYARLMPDNEVQYLGGQLSPAELKEMGIDGIDYHHSIITDNPQWVKEAHKLGMSVNVWTVNSPEQIKEMLNLGVDYITTDIPEEALQIISEYKKN